VVRKTTENALISRRPALFMSAGALVGTLVSAATPIGPREARLRARLRKNSIADHGNLRISWTLTAAKLPREERARLIVEFLEIPDEHIDFGDRVAVAI
jgi:hypothetical protein